MKREKLVSLIKQYTLKTAVEDAIWTVDDQVLTCYFQNESGKVYGNITVKDFELEDGEYPMIQGQSLLKSVGVLSDEITTRDGGDIIFIADQEYEIEVMKAGKNIIDNVSAIATFDEDYPESDKLYSALLDTSFIEQFIKPFKATKTEDNTTFTIHCSNGKMQFRIGNARKIKFDVDATDSVNSKFVGIYLVNLFANMLDANKEAEEIQIEIHELFIYVNFYYSSGTNCQYIIVQLEEESD